MHGCNLRTFNHILKSGFCYIDQRKDLHGRGEGRRCNVEKFVLWVASEHTEKFCQDDPTKACSRYGRDKKYRPSRNQEV